MTREEKAAAIAELKAKLAELEAIPDTIWHIPTDNAMNYYGRSNKEPAFEFARDAPFYVATGQFFNTPEQAEHFALKCAADAAIAAAIEREHVATGAVVDWNNWAQTKRMLIYDHNKKKLMQVYYAFRQLKPTQFHYVGIDMVEMLKSHGITETQMLHHCGVFNQ
jgi:hypothetical protein